MTGVPDYFDRREQMDVAEEMALYRRQGATLGAKDGARRLATVRATPSFFRLTSMAPVAGRIFREEEGEDGKEHEAILSYGLWQREFGGANAIGQKLMLSGTSYEIVGVVPRTWSHLLAVVAGRPIDPTTPVPAGWREHVERAYGRVAPLRMGDGSTAASQGLATGDSRISAQVPFHKDLLHDLSSPRSVRRGGASGQAPWLSNALPMRCVGENALLARRLMHSIRDKASSKATAAATRT